MAGRMLRELCFTKACPTFLRSSELSWLVTLTSRNYQQLVAKEEDQACSCYWYLTVARMVLRFDGGFIDRFHDRFPLEGHQLRFNPHHRQLTRSAGTNRCTRAGEDYFRYCNLIPQSPRLSNWDSVLTSKLWCPCYNFQARLRLHAFKLDCSYHLHIFYENINEDLMTAYRKNLER